MVSRLPGTIYPVPAPRDALLLGLLAGLLLFAGLGATALTDRDEGANAAAAREMLERHAWITPTLAYAPRYAKPAFVYWMMAGAYAGLGVGETAARLPSAVAAVALIGVQYAFARWALGAAVARRAALVLLLSVEFVALARMALTDATLALWTTAAAYAFLRGSVGPAPRAPWYVAAWIAAGLAVLAKGPVGLLAPAAGVLAYLAVAGRIREAWRETRPGRGLLLCLLVAGPWYAAMFWLHGTDYVLRARGETLGRVFRTVTGPGGTALFYIPVLLVGFFPWSAFLPDALRTTLRGARRRAAGGPAAAVTVFAATWLVAGLVLFSVAQSRLPHYVLPLFPAAALLVAATWPATPSATARALLASTGLGLAAGLVAARLAPARAVELVATAYPAAPGATVPASVLGVAAAVGLVAGAALLRDGRRLFPVLGTLAAAGLAVSLHAVLPAFSAQFVRPGTELAARAGALATRCDAILSVGPYRPSFVFYARRPVGFFGANEAGWLVALAALPGRFFVLAPVGVARTLPPGLGIEPIETRGGYVLLASGPAASGCPA